MPSIEYVYKAKDILKVTDGDTFWLYLNVGFYETHLTNIRLLDYDCPELNRGSAFEKERASVAKAITTEFLANGVLSGSLYVRTEKDPDSFGRWLGEVWIETATSYRLLGKALEELNLATVWPTRWREVYDKGAV